MGQFPVSIPSLIPLMHTTFAEAVQEAVRRDSRYAPQAYRLVQAALARAGEIFPKRDGDRHVSGQELLAGFREAALEEFGPMALTILNLWGLRSGLDVGHIVYNLIDLQYFGKSEGDRLEDFEGGYTFEEAFLGPFLPRNWRVDDMLPQLRQNHAQSGAPAPGNRQPLS
jgi:uncharacterized repeat protein (TIGR04138 family)